MFTPRLGEGVEEDEGALVESCRSSGGLPPMLNNLDKVSAGCTLAASLLSPLKLPPKTSDDVLIGVMLIAASEWSGAAVVGRVDSRVADVDRTGLGVLTVRVSAAGLLLDPTSGVNGLAAGVVEEVTAKAKVSGMAAIEVITDVEDIGVGVEVRISAGIEGVFVWLRNRAML